MENRVYFSNQIAIGTRGDINSAFDAINCKYAIITNILIIQPSGLAYDFTLYINRRGGDITLYSYQMDAGDVHTDDSNRILLTGDRLAISGDNGVTLTVDGYRVV